MESKVAKRVFIRRLGGTPLLVAPYAAQKFMKTRLEDWYPYHFPDIFDNSGTSSRGRPASAKLRELTMKALSAKFTGSVLALFCSVCLIQGCKNVPQPERQTDEILIPNKATLSGGELFAAAIDSTGADYLRCEKQLLEGGPDCDQILAANLANSDPMIRLMAKALSDGRHGKRREYSEALELLESYRKSAVGTVGLEPNSQGVANGLSEKYGDRVVDYLALRMAKDPGMAGWCLFAIMEYIAQQKQASATTALIRVAAETDYAYTREAAILQLRKVPDPNLAGKINAEKEHAERKKKPFPPELLRLLEK